MNPQPAESNPTAPQNKGWVPTASHYMALGQVLLVTATLAGAVTFNVLLTVKKPPINIASLLGFASTLFLASITGLFAIILALQSVPDDEHPDPPLFFFVVGGYTVVAIFMCVAFILLMIVLKNYTVLGAFILGIVLLGINTGLTVSMAIWNAWKYKPNKVCGA